MTDQGVLSAILARLERGDAKDDRWPDPKGDYWPLCPFHPDRHSGSFSVGPKGYKCHSCGAGGGLHKLARHLGVTVALLQCCGEGTPPPSPPSLEMYARAKALDAGFLRGLGLETIYLQGKPAVKMPYCDTEGQETAARFRINMTGKNRFIWRKGSKAQPYGLWKLDEARKAGYVYLVEGESDSQTLWSYGLPALGMPGASTFKPEWAAYLDGLTVYVWQEPDQGGETLAAKVGATLPDVRILRPPEGRKDVNEAHILGDDVPALLETLKAKARPWRELEAERLKALAAEAQGEARELLSSPNILAEFDGLCQRLGLVGETANARLLYLALTSRLLDKPVSVAVKGPSSGGKSFTVETVLKTMPESAYLDFTSMSEHALIYDERPVAHKFVVLYEASGLGADRQGEPSVLAYSVRSLLSEGRIRYTTVEKTPDGMQPRSIERQGPTGLITTTTWSSLHPENETRLLSLTVRDDPRQTAAIFQALADRYNGQGPGEPDLAPWLALQTWLELSGERRVTIPYAHELARRCNPKAVRMRRDLTAVFAAISAHAILHQCSRERDAQGRIIATLEDYRVVYDLLLDVVSEGIEAAVSPVVRETVTGVGELNERHERPVSVTELAQYLGVDKSSAARRVRVAIGRDYLTNTEEKRGKPAKLTLGEPLPEEEPALPDPDMLLGSDTVERTGGFPPPETQKAWGGRGGRGVVYPPETTATLQHSRLAELMAQGLSRTEAELVLEAAPDDDFDDVPF